MFMFINDTIKDLLKIYVHHEYYQRFMSMINIVKNLCM